MRPARSILTFTTAALVAVLLPPSPTGAASEYRCLGLPATHVGTPGDDLSYRELPSYDDSDLIVIVSLGGNDYVHEDTDSGARDVYFCGGKGKDVAHGAIRGFNGGRGKDTAYVCRGYLRAALKSVEKKTVWDDCDMP